MANSGDSADRPVGIQRFEHAYGWTLPMRAVGCGIGHSGLEVRDDELRVKMCWAFQMKAPLSEVESAVRLPEPVPWRFGIGVHGWAGQWAVNAARRPQVVITFRRSQRAWTLGLPVNVRVLRLCPADPDGFLRAVKSKQLQPTS